MTHALVLLQAPDFVWPILSSCEVRPISMAVSSLYGDVEGGTQADWISALRRRSVFIRGRLTLAERYAIMRSAALEETGRCASMFCTDVWEGRGAKASVSILELISLAGDDWDGESQTFHDVLAYESLEAFQMLGSYWSQQLSQTPVSVGLGFRHSFEVLALQAGGSDFVGIFGAATDSFEPIAEALGWAEGVPVLKAEVDRYVMDRLVRGSGDLSAAKWRS